MPGMSPWLASSLRPHGEAVVLKGEGLLQQTVPEHSGLAEHPKSVPRHLRRNECSVLRSGLVGLPGLFAARAAHKRSGTSAL